MHSADGALLRVEKAKTPERKEEEGENEIERSATRLGG
jgi:hypothetical protein